MKTILSGFFVFCALLAPSIGCSEPTSRSAADNASPDELAEFLKMQDATEKRHQEEAEAAEK
ncbi:hypothetical protein SAMN06265222_101732 [Neorhodopirellula lusitana]|uniref:Secreted protein n=1 Tax=Neorhodopirellula lusitana TaxID=445327 RepID=A0ABY1PS43_9BACT|nr:hypothetical protein [Neorhodopirellula lusitana]SMP42227.1 hypothetical protein SAMN06265222_101732 [Neorhodopirellula lusitana]